MKIIAITKTKGKGGYKAELLKSEPSKQVFGKTEREAIDNLVDKI